jgi:tetratricopeptide (TPR) repeat protein
MSEAKEPEEILSEEEAERRAAQEDEVEDDRVRFNLEVMGDNVTDAMTTLRDKVTYWADRGRYNKIRIMRGGKPILPDIPVAAVMAFEAATFFWMGPLRAVVTNVVGRVFFEVELINEAEEHYKRGLEHFLAGDLADAEDCLERALRIDDRYPRAHLQLGVLRKVQGRLEDATEHFEKAVVHDKGGDTGREAEVHLKKMKREARQDLEKR